MPVMTASVGTPWAPPMATSDCASATASSKACMNAPRPHFTSSTSACEPSASFLLMIDAEMSGMLSMVAVTSLSP